MMPCYRVGGVWLDAITSAWAHDTISWSRSGGDESLSWSMQLGIRRPAALVAGAIVEVFLGPLRIWRGKLVRPDWNSGTDGTMTFTAQGDSGAANNVPCLSSAGMTTAVPRTAAAQAIARGELDWLDVSALATTSYKDGTSPSGSADETDDLNYLGKLLDAWAIGAQQEWGVHNGVVYMNADPTSPRWLLDPAAGVLGVTREALATKLWGRYQDTTGKNTSISVGSGDQVALIDLTGLGPVSASKANSVLNGILSKTAAVSGWTNGFTITTAQVTSLGGTHPHLAAVAASIPAGVMARLQGQRDPRGIDMGTNVVIGGAEWHPADGTLDLTPMDTVDDDDDLSALVEKVGGVLVS